jgi:hypothetical protein
LEFCLHRRFIYNVYILLKGRFLVVSSNQFLVPSLQPLGETRKDDIRSLLCDHVGRDGSECTRDPGEDRGVNHTETSSSTDLELGVQNGHWVVVSTNGAGGGSVVTPSGVLDVVGNGLLGLSVLSRKNLINLDELALEGVTSKANGLGQSSDVRLPVTGTSVEVVVGDGGDIERVSGLEHDGSSVVAGVGLEDSPGEPVVLVGGVVRVAGEVSTEVDGTTEDEHVPLVAGSSGRLVVHSSTESRGSVDTTVTEDRLLPAGNTWVVDRASLAESAAVQSRKVGWGLSLDVDFVMVLEVGTNTWEVSNDGNTELLQLICGTNTGKLEELRAVVCTTGDDDFAGSLS